MFYISTRYILHYAIPPHYPYYMKNIVSNTRSKHLPGGPRSPAITTPPPRDPPDHSHHTSTRLSPLSYHASPRPPNAPHGHEITMPPPAGTYLCTFGTMGYPPPRTIRAAVPGRARFSL